LAFESTLRTGYEPGKAKSNSLLYLYNADMIKLRTYDVNLDSWTKEYLGENPKPAKDLNQTPLFSKYNSVYFMLPSAPKELQNPLSHS
jgi:hypothetical protein